MLVVDGVRHDLGRGAPHCSATAGSTFLGRTSYSLYLWHVVPFLALSEVTALPKPVVGLVFLALTAVLTLASYRWLEKPFMRARSDVLMPRRTAPAPVAEPAR